MKKWTLACAILLGWLPALCAQPQESLRSIEAIHQLAGSQAGLGLPAVFEGTVTYYNKNDIDLFVQDGDQAIYVQTVMGANLALGDRVLVKGHTRQSFRTDILGDSVTVLHHGELPKPLAADFDSMISTRLDAMRVSVHAKVRSADMVVDGNRYNVYMHLLMDGGYIDATVVASNGSMLKDLLDSEIEAIGVVAGKFDSKNQLTGILLQIPTLADVKIVKHANLDPETLPITPMDEILGDYHVQDLTRRVRVQGTVTYFEPGSAIVLQSGNKSLWINTQSEKRQRLGSLVDVTGFPSATGGSLTMSLGEMWDTGLQMPIAPREVTEPELAAGTHEFELVSTEGQVLTSVRQEAQDEYVLVSGGHVFSAVYHHRDTADGVQIPAMKQIPAGSRVRVTGISMVTYGSNPFQGPVSFSLLLRSFDDIAVVAKPSLLTVKNLIRVVSLLVVLVLAFAIRQWILQRKVHRQTVALAQRTEAEATLGRRMAQLEQQRSKILEDINGSRPLSEIIEQITGLVRFTLLDAPCWCEIADGATLGNSTTEIVGQRLLQHEVVSHSGQLLGKLYALPGEHAQSPEEEAEAMATGARLATLAIETRRIYSDLVYRSEFDQLTDIHNRFSLDKQLNKCIEEARERAGLFGLIYIDLNKFKLVNDQYGHHVGDLYLQEVSQRMGRQLRPGDLLARLGGDEFAVLVPSVRSRADVKDVATRLERCFDDTFAVEGYVLQGSASFGIAVYPEDGSTKDSMLTAADAAMYVGKQTGRRV
ncbi:MAG TPA: GGDEF domain-containing protein [Acidobacteriaceae bacterium]|jgi:diguanylate cyclase (GGDEF)-like protein|nr:GGDEF domain-containing protein [Acidobacteriaceae bacterium]